MKKGRKMTTYLQTNNFGRILSSTAYQRQKNHEAFNPVRITHCRDKAVAGKEKRVADLTVMSGRLNVAVLNFD